LEDKKNKINELNKCLSYSNISVCEDEKLPPVRQGTPKIPCNVDIDENLIEYYDLINHNHNINSAEYVETTEKIIDEKDSVIRKQREENEELIKQ